MGSWLREQIAAFTRDIALNSLILLLLGLSFFATLVGLLGFVDDRAGGANFASRSTTTALVLTLTLAMYIALRETLRPRRWIYWPAAAALYTLLALWSIGFGYGYWWSALASGPATERTRSEAVEIVRTGAADAIARLDAASSQMAAAVTLSEQRAAQEKETGGSCGRPSRPGDGPRTRARLAIHTSVSDIALRLETQWRPPLSTEIDTVIGLVATADLSDADAFDANLIRARQTADRLEATAKFQSQAIADDLRTLSKRLNDPTGLEQPDGCFDPLLGDRLSAVSTHFDAPFRLSPPALSSSAGQAGVAEAIESLWRRAGGIVGLTHLTPTTPLTGRALAALIAAIAVDVSLFAFTLLQPRRRGLEGLSRQPEPETTRLDALANLAHVAFAGRDLVDTGRLKACFGAEGDARLLLAPKPQPSAAPSETNTALALGDYVMALADAGEVKPARLRTSKAAHAATRRLILAGWSEHAAEAMTTFETAPGLMRVYLEAALSAIKTAPGNDEPQIPQTDLKIDRAQLVQPPTPPRLELALSDSDPQALLEDWMASADDPDRFKAADRALKDAGLTLIRKLGVQADPKHHLIVEWTESASRENQVVEIQRPGLLDRDGRVVSRALVVVSSGIDVKRE